MAIHHVLTGQMPREPPGFEPKRFRYPGHEQPIQQEHRDFGHLPRVLNQSRRVAADCLAGGTEVDRKTRKRERRVRGRILKSVSRTPVVERVPASAAAVALLGLAVVTVASWRWPGAIREYSVLVWMLAILPFLLLAHFKAWRRISGILAVALVGLALIQFGMVQWLGMAPPDSLAIGFVVVSLIAFSFCIGLISQSRLNRRASTLYLAASDPLTGLHSADALRFFLDRCFAAAGRGRALAVVMFDMDGLGVYGGCYGPAAADEAIRNVADILDANTRSMDMSGRFGDDEFLALLPGGTTADAFTFAVRVRKAVESSAAFQSSGMTVSAGVASFTPRMVDADDLLKEARAVMLAAREAGGNRVMRSANSGEQAWVAEPEPARREGVAADS